MQRTKRRGSVSTISNVSTRGIRTGSRTSSAGGDCPLVSRNSNRYGETNEGKLKLRSSRYNARVMSNAPKNQTKKGSKTQRPTFSSLQNAVVLAPFYTLKRCFQTKLVDLYSQERLKKLNNKVRSAKKKNVAFEYDVVEVKSPFGCKTANKKETARKKKAAAAAASAAAKSKTKRGSRSQSYCQCDRNLSKVAKLGKHTNKMALRHSKGRKSGAFPRAANSPPGEAAFVLPQVQLPLSMFNSQANKRRKNDNQVVAMGSLLDEGFNLNYATSNEKIPLEGTSQSISNLSSRIDSWETFSDSLSLREEHLKASLAISTTSFDSCLEQSSRQTLETNHKNPNKTKRYTYHTRFRELAELKETEREQPIGFPPQSDTNQSRHLIMNSETKSSDDRITDFLDREPQSQGIVATNIPENLQPLPRLSRTKGRKPEMEAGPSASNNYYLRSVREGVREVADGDNYRKYTSPNYTEGHGGINYRKSTSQKMLENASRRRFTQNADTATSHSSEDGNIDSAWKQQQQQQQPPDTHTHFILSPQSKTVVESSSLADETSDPQHSKATCDLNKTATLQEQEAKKPTGTELNASCTLTNVEPCEVLHQRKSNLSETEQETPRGSQTNGNNKSGETNSKEEVRSKSRIWSGNPPEVGPEEEESFNGIHSLPRVGDEIRFQGSPSPNSSVVSRKPQDKEPSFIFGPRSTSARFGGSCDFTFGLNWAVPDEDDSDHGDRFY